MMYDFDMTKVDKIIKEARRCADTIPNFEKGLGAGKGNRVTNHFMNKLRDGLRGVLTEEEIEAPLLNNNSRVDFYIKKEGAIVEVALSLKNSNSEFFKDIFKALIAQDCGWRVKKLIFISKRGAVKRCEQPLYKDTLDWIKNRFGIVVEIKELCNGGII